VEKIYQLTPASFLSYIDATYPILDSKYVTLYEKMEKESHDFHEQIRRQKEAATKARKGDKERKGDEVCDKIVEILQEDYGDDHEWVDFAKKSAFFEKVVEDIKKAPSKATKKVIAAKASIIANMFQRVEDTGFFKFDFFDMSEPFDIMLSNLCTEKKITAASMLQASKYHSLYSSKRRVGGGGDGKEAPVPDENSMHNDVLRLILKGRNFHGAVLDYIQTERFTYSNASGSLSESFASIVNPELTKRGEAASAIVTAGGGGGEGGAGLAGPSKPPITALISAHKHLAKSAWYDSYSRSKAQGASAHTKESLRICYAQAVSLYNEMWPTALEYMSCSWIENAERREFTLNQPNGTGPHIIDYMAREVTIDALKKRDFLEMERKAEYTMLREYS